jgi:hypothetical protein
MSAGTGAGGHGARRRGRRPSVGGGRRADGWKVCPVDGIAPDPVRSTVRRAPSPPAQHTVTAPPRFRYRFPRAGWPGQARVRVCSPASRRGPRVVEGRVTLRDRELQWQRSSARWSSSLTSSAKSRSGSLAWPSRGWPSRGGACPSARSWTRSGDGTETRRPLRIPMSTAPRVLEARVRQPAGCLGSRPRADRRRLDAAARVAHLRCPPRLRRRGDGVTVALQPGDHRAADLPPGTRDQGPHGGLVSR